MNSNWMNGLWSLEPLWGNPGFLKAISMILGAGGHICGVFQWFLQDNKRIQTKPPICGHGKVLVEFFLRYRLSETGISSSLFLYHAYTFERYQSIFSMQNKLVLDVRHAKRVPKRKREIFPRFTSKIPEIVRGRRKFCPKGHVEVFRFPIFIRISLRITLR